MATPKKRFQIFVSSTYDDLKDQRNSVIRMVLEMGHIPVGMELFNAADESQWQHIARQIERTDYYIVIIAHRYGTETKDGVSYTEKEYDYANSQGVPTLGFIIDKDVPWPPDQMDKGDTLACLDRFKERVRQKMVKFWSSEEDLRSKVATSLMYQMGGSDRPGWIRADQAIEPSVANELSRVSKENQTLRDELAKLEQEKESRPQNIDKDMLKLLRIFALLDSDGCMLDFLLERVHWKRTFLKHKLDQLGEAGLIRWTFDEYAGSLVYMLTPKGRSLAVEKKMVSSRMRSDLPF